MSSAAKADPAGDTATGPGGRAGRLLSLDVFRGLVVAGMILVNNAGSAAIPALGHVQWNGLGFADIVFPSFVFIIGVGTALSLAGSTERRGWTWWRRLFIRVAILIALGLLINAVYARAAGLSRFGFDGVLQRIALASLLAAPFARLRPPQALAVALAFLAIHTALLLAAPFPGGRPGDLSRPDDTFPAYVDARVFGGSEHLDPENLFGTVSTAGGLMLGAAAGGVLFRRRRAAATLAIGGAVALAAGLAATQWLPLNKRLWTATFVLVTAGIDAIVLALLHRLVDGRTPAPRLARWIEPLGRNPLLLYVGSTLLAGILLSIPLPGGSAYVRVSDVFHALFGPVAGVLAFAAAWVALWYAIAVVLYRRRIFVRL